MLSITQTEESGQEVTTKTEFFCPLEDACTIPLALCCGCCYTERYVTGNHPVIDLVKSKTGMTAVSKADILSVPQVIAVFVLTPQYPEDAAFRQRWEGSTVCICRTKYWVVLNQQGSAPLAAMVDHGCEVPRNKCWRDSVNRTMRELETAVTQENMLPGAYDLLVQQQSQALAGPNCTIELIPHGETGKEELCVIVNRPVMKGEPFSASYFGSTLLTEEEALMKFGQPCCCKLCDWLRYMTRLYAHAQRMAAEKERIQRTPLRPCTHSQVIDLTLSSSDDEPLLEQPAATLTDKPDQGDPQTMQ